MEAHPLEATLARQLRGELDQLGPHLDRVVHRVPADERSHLRRGAVVGAGQAVAAQAELCTCGV